MDRREVLAGAAMLSGALLGGEALAQAGRRSTRNFRRIATEEAFATPEFVEACRDIVKAGWNSKDLDFWRGLLFRQNDPRLADLLDLDQQRLATMDKQGIDMQLLSLTSPGVQFFEPMTATTLATTANDHLAEAIRRHPTRYAGLAAFAPQDPKGAVKEMERAINGLKLNGFILNSHTNGEYMDDPKFRPILEAAAALGPIYIHPRPLPDTIDGPYRDMGLWTAMWGFQVETSLHALRILFSGAFDDFPDLKIVLGHMGEGIPYWLYRLDYMYPKMERMFTRKLKKKPSEYVKSNFIITTSGMNDPAALKYCVEVLGPRNVMWAIDYPYQEAEEATTFMNTAPVSDEDKALIFSGNAERVFKIAQS